MPSPVRRARWTTSHTGRQPEHERQELVEEVRGLVRGGHHDAGDRRRSRLRDRVRRADGRNESASTTRISSRAQRGVRGAGGTGAASSRDQRIADGVATPRLGFAAHGARTADLVVVGAGTVGGWASVFATRARGGTRGRARREAVAGAGASSRAGGHGPRAGRHARHRPPRAPGRSTSTGAQAARYGTDSGFVGRGYVILAVDGRRRAGGARTDRDATRDRPGRAVGGPRRGPRADPRDGGARATAAGPTWPPTAGSTRPATSARTAWRCSAPGVDLRERVAFTGLRTGRGGRASTGVETSAGTIATARVLLTGGPRLHAVARLAGASAWVGYARHQVVVTEPSPACTPTRPRWRSTSAPGSTGGPRRAGSCGACRTRPRRPARPATIDWDVPAARWSAACTDSSRRRGGSG